MSARDVREVGRRYEDPLDLVWCTTAARLGLSIERSADVYLHVDGRGTLVVGTPETLDADDSLAQLVFHEICHALVEGPHAFALRDWGLCNRTDAHLPREHACLAVQAELARRFGLRAFLTPTTEHRAFFDALAPDPLVGLSPGVAAAARAALERVAEPPYAPHVAEALRATAAIVTTAKPFAGDASLFA